MRKAHVAVNADMSSAGQFGRNTAHKKAADVFAERRRCLPRKRQGCSYLIYTITFRGKMQGNRSGKTAIFGLVWNINETTMSAPEVSA